MTKPVACDDVFHSVSKARVASISIATTLCAMRSSVAAQVASSRRGGDAGGGAGAGAWADGGGGPPGGGGGAIPAGDWAPAPDAAASHSSDQNTGRKEIFVIGTTSGLSPPKDQ
jgi:hypothetical protein